MRTASSLSLFVVAFLAITTLVTKTLASPTCENVTWTVSPSLPGYSSAAGDQWSISGKFCEAENHVAARSNTIQLLVHGVSYTKDYWAHAPSRPGNETYSWIDYASSEGYSTFSFDRICNGDSTHLASVECQLSVNAAVIHQLVQKLRSGALGRPFSKVVWVGHSLGSVTGHIYATTYDDIDGYVLTGYTMRFFDGILGNGAAFGVTPAVLALPDKYSSLDLGYLVASDLAGFQRLMYDGDFDTSVASNDFANRGTLAVGEFVQVVTNQQSVSDYAGPIMVLTGHVDQFFCAVSEMSGMTDQQGDCGSDAALTAELKKVFPAVPEGLLKAKQIQSTGHSLNFHLSSQDTFYEAHAFLEAQGF